MAQPVSFDVRSDCCMLDEACNCPCICFVIISDRFATTDATVFWTVGSCAIVWVFSQQIPSDTAVQAERPPSGNVLSSVNQMVCHIQLCRSSLAWGESCCKGCRVLKQWCTFWIFMTGSQILCRTILVYADRAYISGWCAFQSLLASETCYLLVFLH